MAAEIKTELQIPDLWYDFYARIVPGTAFAVTVRVGFCGVNTTPTLVEAGILLAIGFFVALLTQPFASRITGRLDSLACLIKGCERDYVRGVTTKLGSSTRRSLILSKMHGEATFFVQLALLAIIYWLLIVGVNSATDERTGLFASIFAIIFIALAMEIRLRRLDRAKAYDKLPAEKPEEKPRE